MAVTSTWETEKIGIVITFSCLMMVLFNRAHKYVSCVKCWSKGENIFKNSPFKKKDFKNSELLTFLALVKLTRFLPLF